MSFIAFAWLASILYGSVIIITKLTSKYTIKNQLLFNFLYASSILLWTIPVGLLNHAGFPTHWGNIILTGFFYGISGLLYILAIYKLDVSTIGPLYNFQTAFAVILAGLLLGEKLVGWQYFLVIIIFIAGLFTSIDEKLRVQSFFQWPVFIAIVSALCLALADIYTHKAIVQNNYWTVTLWVPFVSELLFLSTIPFFAKEVKTLSVKPILALSIIGMFDTLAVLAINKAYAVNVSLSVVIISLPISLLFVIFLSMFFHMYWKNIQQKYMQFV